MNAQELKKEILENYIDKEFQITIIKNPWEWSTGNGLLHCAVFYTLLYINDLIGMDDVDRFERAVGLCWVYGNNSRVVQGLLNRNLGRPDLEGADDYHIVTPSLLLGTYHRMAVHMYGEENLWSFDNQNPFNKNMLWWRFWRSWHGRFIGRIPYYRICSGQVISWLETKQIKIDIGLGPSKDSSTAIQQWLRIQAYKKRSSEFHRAISRWELDANKMYGSFNKMVSGYFGADHPFSRYSISVQGVIS